VAEHARVNHGLVHRHFGSKEGLLRAVLDDLSARIFREARAADDEPFVDDELGLPDLLESSFWAVNRHPLYWRVLAQALLDGGSISELQTSFPVVESLVARVEQAQARQQLDRGLDARMFVAVLVSAGLGWLLFAPYVLAATGQAALSRSEVIAKLAATWRALAPRAPRQRPA
jgi:AcrR family transcriptional regulator